MKWLCIENPKVVPLAALEMIGATDKAGGGFIGVFGSGSKNGIAAALRNNIDIRIYSGSDVITFDTTEELLGRGIVNRIRSKVNQRQPVNRDWTIEMGQQDWRNKEDHGLTIDWMIAREFISNAIDDGGCSMSIEEKLCAKPGHTRVYLRLTDPLRHVLNNIDLYFARHFTKQRTPIVTNTRGRVYARSGLKGRVYCKGVFVRELDEDVLYDYDLDFLTLSESRTVDSYYLGSEIVTFLCECEPDFVSTVLSGINSNPKCFEAKIPDYQLSRLMNKKELMQGAFTRAFGENSYVAPEHLSIHMADALQRCGGTKIGLPDQWVKTLSGSGVNDYVKAIGKDIVDGYDFVADEDISVKLDPNLVQMCVKAYNDCAILFASQMKKDMPKLRFFFWRGSPDAMVLGRAGNNYIAINAQMTLDRVLIMETMIEEMAHYASGAGDLSRHLVTSICRAMASYLS